MYLIPSSPFQISPLVLLRLFSLVSGAVSVILRWSSWPVHRISPSCTGTDAVLSIFGLCSLISLPQEGPLPTYIKATYQDTLSLYQ